MNNLQVIEIKEQRVLTTKQIAEAYETKRQVITNNFNRNKSRYEEGKHYIRLTGIEKAEFIKKNQNEFSCSERAKAIYLWTEKGALLHAKSLNTDKAWEVYDYLVDFYFRAKEVQREKSGEQREPARPLTRLVVDIPVNEQAQELIQEIEGNMAGMKSLIRMYNRYLTEENYKKVVYVMRDMCMEMSNMGFRLASVQPGMMEKKMC